MGALRHLARRHLGLAALLFVAALALRLLVPAGFMPVANGMGGVSLGICTGVAPLSAAAAMPGMTHHGSDGGEQAGKSCAFADLSVPLLGGADPVQLAAALLFYFAAALLLVAALPVAPSPRLRPPLRGPPLP